MKTLIISYSATGNNDKIAAYIAKELKMDHIRVNISNSKITLGLMFKHLFNVKPKILPPADVIDKYDYIILCAPIWMGKIAVPLKSYITYLKEHPRKYGFITVRGNVENPNKTISQSLEKMIGTKPSFVNQQTIESILRDNNNYDPKDIISYKLNDKDIDKMTDTIIKDFKKNN